MGLKEGKNKFDLHNSVVVEVVEDGQAVLVALAVVRLGSARSAIGNPMVSRTSFCLNPPGLVELPYVQCIKHSTKDSLRGA